MPPAPLRSRRALPVGLALAGCLASVPAFAQSPDAAVGRGAELAQMICSACHAVAAKQEFPPLLTPPAPSFLEIANRPDTNLKSLHHFIVTTHWDMQHIPMTMPNPMLSSAETDAVARYIMSLRKK